MTNTKKLLLAFFIILILPFLIALFTPKDYAVSREIRIKQPLDEVFSYVSLLKNQDAYSKWGQMDPEMKKTYRGKDGEVGFVSAWESDHKDVGVGEQEIVRIIPGKRIDYELRFMEPFESTSPAHILTESLSAGETKVTWGFEGHMPYPMNLMLLFMDFEQLIGDDLEVGLNNLKDILENQN